MNSQGLSDTQLQHVDGEQPSLVEVVTELPVEVMEETPVAVAAAVPNLDDSSRYIHRELSQLQFNLPWLMHRLSEPRPPLERLRFVLIFSSNLDEFSDIRVARLTKQVTFAREQAGADGLQPH